MERQIPLRELNQQTSAVLSEVARGGAVTITRDGRPIARLVPLGAGSARLDELVASGRAIAPTARGVVRLPRVHGDETIDVSAAIARDRADGRW